MVRENFHKRLSNEQKPVQPFFFAKTVFQHLRLQKNCAKVFLFRSDPVPTDYLETEEQEKEKNSMLRCPEMLEMMKLKLGMVGALLLRVTTTEEIENRRSLWLKCIRLMRLLSRYLQMPKL